MAGPKKSDLAEPDKEMGPMKLPLVAALLAALAFGLPAAAEPATPLEEFEQKANEAARQFLGALALLVEAMPQYQAPQLLDNGDIVIRRKRDGDAPQDSPVPSAPYPPGGECECRI